ncbi:hypothetical protein FJTKL_07402 [Diaporthe vaccinii]|uniref:Uncharacterized protein n=1 Tax=Diaporthe vaccinii TaxID=105482 RepID=A0ABR4EU02_9PEZI
MEAHSHRMYSFDLLKPNGPGYTQPFFPSNFVYVRTFSGSTQRYYTFVTCLVSQPGLRTIVVKGEKYSSRRGYHVLADDALPEMPTPSFLHLSPDDAAFEHISTTKDLNQKYLLQFARDEDITTESLETVHNRPGGDGAIGIYQTNEDQDGFQRAFGFGTEISLKWSGSTEINDSFFSYERLMLKKVESDA